MTVADSMGLLSNRFMRNLIALVAVINIIIMMLFQYWLPTQSDIGTVNHAEDSGDNVGTIEAVEQETAEKEEKEAQTVLAREEKTEEDEEPQEERDPDAPILELTDHHIYLKVGDRFNYMSYIKTMEDVDGSDLSHYIYLDKDVDTSEPGEIELTYRITSVITGKSDSQVLLITIRE